MQSVQPGSKQPQCLFINLEMTLRDWEQAIYGNSVCRIPVFSEGLHFKPTVPRSSKEENCKYEE